jgi:hypothetical protein
MRITSNLCCGYFGVTLFFFHDVGVYSEGYSRRSSGFWARSFVVLRLACVCKSKDWGDLGVWMLYHAADVELVCRVDLDLCNCKVEQSRLELLLVTTTLFVNPTARNGTTKPHIQTF